MANQILFYLWIGFQVLIGYNLIFPMILFFCSLLKKYRFEECQVEISDYAIIVTAYEQTAHLPEVINSLLNLRCQEFMIYVVADCCDISVLEFDKDKVMVLRPEEPLRSNVKSHFYAINRFVRNHPRLTIIDSDNLVHPNFINELDKYFAGGFSAVQGTRMPKNLNTNFACLDAARDLYYHFYDSKILFNLGSSSTLSGSGMAFKTTLYMQCMKPHENLAGAGFDKILQSEILLRNLTIAFAEKAIVYDGKSTHPEQLVNQRSRWIHTWFKYFDYGFILIKKGISTRSINQFLFGLTISRPPLFLFLIVSLICAMINLFFNPFTTFIWLMAFLLFITGFWIALYKSDTDPKIYRSLKNIPLFMFYQLIALFKRKKAEQNVATVHSNTPFH